MQLSALISLLASFASLLPLSLAQNCTPPATPQLTSALTAHVCLSNPIGPIPIPGGITIVESITNGTITGPALNATITAGSAIVSLFPKNATIAKPFVELSGFTDDGVPFHVEATGVGVQGAQLATISISIGGKYAYLEKEYILASFTDDDANPPIESTIQGWIVTRDS